VHGRVEAGGPVISVAPRRPRLTFHQRTAIAGFLFILPTWLHWLVWTGFGAALSLGASLTQWNIVSAPTFVGLDNYAALLRDDSFRLALRNTLAYLGLVTPIAVVIAATLAILINETGRFRELFRIAYFLPVVTSMAAVALLWKWLYQPTFGLFNYLLGRLGVDGLNWLGDERTALLSVALMMVWKGLGFHIVLFLAGLQTIPEHLYEAAAIDGAGRWQRIWHVTVPLLKPTTVFVCITSMASALQLFLPVYLMTGGGPAHASSVLALLVWEHAFKFLNAGYASAIASIMFAMMMAITVAQLKLFQRE
jgi:multiple sugar transport system permease protein